MLSFYYLLFIPGWTVQFIHLRIRIDLSCTFSLWDYLFKFIQAAWEDQHLQNAVHSAFRQTPAWISSVESPTLSLPDINVAFQNTQATYLLIKIPTKQSFSLWGYFCLLLYVLLNVPISQDLVALCSRKLKTGITFQHASYGSFTSTPRIRFQENKQLLSIANHFPKQILAPGYIYSAATFPLPVRSLIQKYHAEEITA